MAVIVTPDAVVFRAHGAFHVVTGGHPPVFGTAAAASSAEPAGITPVRDLLLRVSPAALARMAAVAAADSDPEGMALTDLERVAPGFEKTLRALQRETRSEASISEAPAGRLRVSLDAATYAECFAGRANGKMPLPVSLAAPFLIGGPLAVPGGAVPSARGSTVVVDSRIETLPCACRDGNGSL